MEARRLVCEWEFIIYHNFTSYFCVVSCWGLRKLPDIVIFLQFTGKIFVLCKIKLHACNFNWFEPPGMKGSVPICHPWRAWIKDEYRSEGASYIIHGYEITVISIQPVSRKPRQN